MNKLADESKKLTPTLYNIKSLLPTIDLPVTLPESRFFYTPFEVE